MRHLLVKTAASSLIYKMFTKSVFLSLLSSIAYALPTGSPYCEIDQSKMAAFQSAHSPESKSTGFSAQFNPENGSYKVLLSKKEVPIHGVLMYVTGVDKSKHLGSFTSKDKFQFVTGESCGGPDSTITHADQSEKSDTEFIWTPGQNDKGPFTLNAVVSGMKNPWTMLQVPAASQAPSAPKTSLAPTSETASAIASETTLAPAESDGVDIFRYQVSSSEGVSHTSATMHEATATTTVCMETTEPGNSIEPTTDIFSIESGQECTRPVYMLVAFFFFGAVA